MSYKKSDIVNEIKKSGYSLIDIKNDDEKKEAIVSTVSKKMLTDTSEIEIFAALFIFLQFAPPRTYICFEIDDRFNSARQTINSLEELKKFIKEKTLTDFAQLSYDGLRQFQLKQYKGELNTEDLCAYIEKKLKHYGGNIRDVNILFHLQGPRGNDEFLNMEIDFSEIHERLRSYLSSSFNEEILISYNDSDRALVMVRVMPTLIQTERPLFSANK